MKSYDIIQIPHSYSFVLGFFGVCAGASDADCKEFDMGSADFRRVVDSVYEVSSEQSNTTFAWFKSDLHGTNLNHFEKLTCGKSYYFVVKPGVGRIKVPHLYATNSGTSKNDLSGRVTTNCDMVQATPTPVADCCNNFGNSIVTTGTKTGTESLNGVKVFGFEFGGKFCFDSLDMTYVPSRYNFKTDDNSIVGWITTTGIFKNKKVRYTSKKEECYESTIQTQNGFNILKKR